MTGYYAEITAMVGGSEMVREAFSRDAALDTASRIAMIGGYIVSIRMDYFPDEEEGGV